MPESRACSRCGAALAPTIEGPICPACLIEAALAESDLTVTETFLADATPKWQIARAPDRVGPYRILGPLGEGGMGVVYLAEQAAPIRRRVALKLIKLGMDTRQVVARFDAERQALALMDHPNIASVFDAGATDDGRPYFAMEHVPGIPITEYCDKQRLSTCARLKLFVQVCVGVQHAHQKGIIHRDIKPSNILVMVQDGRPVPKVIDFGVAKATHQRLTEKTVFTELGLWIGTPEYMSPEQAEMSGMDVDTTTDIYSLGVLLYELLVGTLPFDPTVLRQAGYAEIQRIIRQEDPPRPSARLSGLGKNATEVAKQRQTDLASLARELKGDLDWITLKAMEKNRTIRYPSASELAADVERHLSRDPVIARPASAVYRVRKFLGKHKVGVAAGVLAAAALVTGLVISAIMYFRAESARDDAERQAYSAILAAVDAQIMASESGPGRSIASDDVKRRLSAVPRQRRGWEWNYLAKKLDGSIAKLWGAVDLTVPSLYRGRLTLSSDQREVLWATNEGVHAWDLNARRLTGAWPGYGTVWALAQDGSRLLSANSSQPHVWRIIETRTGSTVSTLDFEGSIHDAVFSPNGEQVAMVGEDASIQVWAVSSGRRIAIARPPRIASFVRFAADQALLVAGVERNLYVWRYATGAAAQVIDAKADSALLDGDLTRSGETAVTIDGAGTLRSWQTATTQVSVLGQHRRAKAVAISARGRFVATAADDGVMQLWNVWSLNLGNMSAPMGIPVVLDPHEDLAIDSLVFARNDAYLVAGSRWGLVRVWDVPTAILSADRRQSFINIGVGAAAFDVASNGRFAVLEGFIDFRNFGRRDNLDNLWVVNLETLDRVSTRDDRPFELDDSRTPVGRHVAVSHDGKRIVVGRTDGSLLLWRGDHGASLELIARLPGPITAVAISADGSRAAAASAATATGAGAPSRNGRGNGHLGVWDLSAAQQEILRADTDDVEDLAFSDSAHVLLATPLVAPVSDHSNCIRGVRLWNLKRRNVGLEIRDCAPRAVLAASDTRIVAHSLHDHRIRVWDSRSGSLVSTSAPINGVSALAATPDGSRFAARVPGGIDVFDLHRAEWLFKIWVPPRNRAQVLRYSSDGFRLIEVGSMDIQVHDAANAYDPDIQLLVDQLLDPSVSRAGFVRWSRGTVARTIEELRKDASLDPEKRRAAIEEVERVGDRDAFTLCGQSKETAVRPNGSPEEYRQALQNAMTASRLIPWSASCLGVVSMAMYRVGDYTGTLNTLARTLPFRSETPAAEMVFRGMALHRLGRTVEAAAVAQSLRAQAATSSDAELKALINELESVLRTQVAPTQKPQ